MTKSEQTEITKVLAGLAVWFGQAVSDERIAMYVKHLEEYDYQIIINILKHIKVSARFFPQMCEILGTYPGGVLVEAQATRDWIRIRTAASWSTDILSLEDKKISRSVWKSMGGSHLFGKWDMSIDHLKMQEFTKKYVALSHANALHAHTELSYTAHALFEDNS